MQSHLHTQVNRKVSRFILGEEGKVGSQSAFTAAAFIGATSLAGMFLSAPNATAGADDCGVKGTDNNPICNEFDRFCCYCWDPELNVGHHDCAPKGEYRCTSLDKTSPGLTCWDVMEF